MTMRSHLRKLVRGTSGQEIIEAAIVIPLLFMILFGIYWFGRAFNIYGTINHAAREGARVAIQTCASCAQLTKPLLDAQVASAVTQALQASHLDPAKAGTYNPAPAPAIGACPGAFSCTNAVTIGAGRVRICRPVQLNAGSADPPVCGVTVSFKYPYQFWFPFTSLNSVSLKASVQADGEE
jgi:Flp pilus assembly protein TadG